MQRGQHHSAKVTFESLKKYHEVIYLGKEADKQLNELNEMIVNGHEPLLIGALSKVISEKPKSINELRKSYQEIHSKKLSDIISVLDGEDVSVEDFLYCNIYSIVNELQLRKKNLNIVKNNEKKISHRIIKEDLVNDWLTSLFDHKLSHLGLSCRDQKRGGQSSSEENPGEIDFFLCGKDNDRIGTMEAFRLFSNDTTVISDHLNKIAGYDQECLSPVFIITYCDVTNFSSLCINYNNDCQEKEYKGFKKSLEKEDSLTAIINSSTVTTYKETRFRGNKPIIFYHLMVNLRFQ